jgi:two-component system chemotaxis response regulator CheY
MSSTTPIEKLLASLSILIVDDSASMRLLLRGLLTVLEVPRITEAQDGEDALLALQSQKIDLVITDLEMRPMDGIEFTKRLRASKPDLPILMLSSHVESSRVQSAIRAGVNDFLVKPVVPRNLEAKLHRLMANQASKVPVLI